MTRDIIERLKCWAYERAYDVNPPPASDLMDAAAAAIVDLRAILRYERACAEHNNRDEECAILKKSLAEQIQQVEILARLSAGVRAELYALQIKYRQAQETIREHEEQVSSPLGHS